MKNKSQKTKARKQKPENKSQKAVVISEKLVRNRNYLFQYYLSD